MNWFSLLNLLGLGFLLGLEHALDADHVVAVSTIVSESRSLRRSSLIGALWGMGHTTTLLIAGGILLALRLTIPTRLAQGFELLVGVVLIVLGVRVLILARREGLHLHLHRHGPEDPPHVHLHGHREGEGHEHLHVPFLVGLVHGLAGSAALMLLILTTVDSLAVGIVYILIFGLGSILGMFLLSTLIGLPFLLAGRIRALQQGVRWVAGGISIVLGLTIVYQIAVVQHLLF